MPLTQATLTEPLSYEWEPMGYNWEPMSHGCFRLLYVKPSRDPTSRIDAELRVHHIDDDLMYHTLSYHWGAPHERELTSRVYTPVGTIPITSKVEDILRVFRSYPGMIDQLKSPQGQNHAVGRAIWLDAVCIDQTNVQERQCQVAMIGKIYSRSQMLLIWLGHFLPLNETRSLVAASHDDYQSMVEPLREHPYFTRLWPVQEIIRTEPMSRRRVLLEYGFMSQAAVFRLLLRFRPTMDYQSGRERHNRCSLLDNLRKYHRLECTDPRDRVFSLISISDDAVLRQNPLSADYGSSFSTIYQHLASLYVVSPNHYVYLLACATAFRDSDSTVRKHRRDWPSWVPRWHLGARFTSENHMRTLIWSHCCSRARGQIQVCGVPDRCWGESSYAPVLMHDRRIKVSGWLIRSTLCDVDSDDCTCPFHTVQAFAKEAFNSDVDIQLRPDQRILLLEQSYLGFVLDKTDEPTTYTLSSCCFFISGFTVSESTGSIVRRTRLQSALTQIVGSLREQSIYIC
jgi:hypothetical protein